MLSKEDYDEYVVAMDLEFNFGPCYAWGRWRGWLVCQNEWLGRTGAVTWSFVRLLSKRLRGGRGPFSRNVGPEDPGRAYDRVWISRTFYCSIT